MDISGYGAYGPYADKRAYDMLVQCEAGLVSVTGTPEQPVKAGVPAADIAAAMYAFSGVLAALVRRGTTGRGGPVEVSMLEALAEWMGHPLHHAMHDGAPPARTGLAHAVIAPYDAYATADGGRVLLSVQNDREWRRLAERVMERPELGTDPVFATNAARVAHRERTDAEVARALGALTAEEAQARLEDAGIACARLRDVREVAEHPQLAARGAVAGGGLAGGTAEGAAPADHLAGWGAGAERGRTRARAAHRSFAACRGDDGRRYRSAAPGRCGRLSAGPRRVRRVTPVAVSARRTANGGAGAAARRARPGSPVRPGRCAGARCHVRLSHASARSPRPPPAAGPRGPPAPRDGGRGASWSRCSRR
ncbi:hypothetical protein GCM10020295_66300 [Streptomyces cinereospinus]